MSAPGFATFERTLASQGLRAALATLIEHTPFRYVGIWRFEGDESAAAAHVDREHPDELRAGPVPSTATYCSNVRAAREPFVLADSADDARVAAHPAREAVRAYVGVPLVTPEGEILGTLCCYDAVPRATAQIDLALMAEVSSHLVYRGLVPPYPRAE